MHIPKGFQIRQILDETLAVPGGEVLTPASVLPNWDRSFW